MLRPDHSLYFLCLLVKLSFSVGLPSPKYRTVARGYATELVEVIEFRLLSYRRIGLAGSALSFLRQKFPLCSSLQWLRSNLGFLKAIRPPVSSLFADQLLAPKKPWLIYKRQRGRFLIGIFLVLLILDFARFLDTSGATNFFWIWFLYLVCFNQVKGNFDFRFLAAEIDFLAQGTAGFLFHISTRTELEITKA